MMTFKEYLMEMMVKSKRKPSGIASRRNLQSMSSDEPKSRAGAGGGDSYDDKNRSKGESWKDKKVKKQYAK